ncbi:MAG: tyrosine-protein phosphatase [Bacteroidales bacterium]|nr:tyrosine-protein phosphatase [Bacteroidales bacterium]
MKKFLKYALVALTAATLATVSSCNPEKDTPQPQNEYSGPVEGTSDWGLVGTILESNWGDNPGKDYIAVKEGDIYVLKNVKLAKEDEFKFRRGGAWTENYGGEFEELDHAFFADAGGSNIKPGLDGIFDIYLNLGAGAQIAVCTRDSDPEWFDPEVKDGDVILVTSPLVERFITEVNYTARDYSYTELKNYTPSSPGDSDRPLAYVIRLKANTTGEDLAGRLWEDDGWSRDITVSGSDKTYRITNLRPNANYHYSFTTSSGKAITSGSFKTTGHVHQLFFYSRVRNCRDLGGWSTEDGKTVKYRKIYRGGRLESGTLTGGGKTDLLAEGIRAQLDLRGKSDVLTESPVEGITFLGPVIEEGYTHLLQNDKEKARQCMQFIMDCVDQNKPVYFHCSLGRDRTGTIAMLTLGVLGVYEGDISKEYELTQFAPHSWATSEGEKTKMTRMVDYKNAANYIWNNYVATGETFRDGVEKYLIEIGISQADIVKFRNNMLQ